MIYGIVLFVILIVLILSILSAIENIKIHMKIMSNDVNDLYRAVCELNNELKQVNKK